LTGIKTAHHDVMKVNKMIGVSGSSFFNFGAASTPFMRGTNRNYQIRL
jgi:hypothetical protein